jgi:RES domain-containing protein
MSRRIYRVCRAIHARLDGEGAKSVGGRWNSPGRSVVYMAETISLAVPENLVHMAKEDFPAGYVVVTAIVPDRIVVLTEEDLVEQFGSADQRRPGDQWIDLRVSAVLAVRSTIVPFEHNYLLNPRHPDFAAITGEPPVPFVFDERLFGYRPVR